jgi:hypothetical protein
VDDDKSREQLIQELTSLRGQIRRLAPISDAMTQSLYGLNLYANAATDRLASGDVALTLEYLEQCNKTTQLLLSTAQFLSHHLCAASHQGCEEQES